MLSNGKYRVLVIESHAFDRSLELDSFEGVRCFEIFFAETGQQALLELNKVGYIDLAIFGMQLADMDGLEFAQSAGKDKLLGSLVISEFLPAEIRKIMCRVTEFYGIRYLGDLDKPINNSLIKNLLRRCKRPISLNTQTKYEFAGGSFGKEQLLEALRSGEIASFYQPKFNLITKEITGSEVLSRWLHPKRGVLLPSNFLPELKKYGLTGLLLNAQLKSGIALKKVALNLGFNFNLAFNVEPRQLNDNRFMLETKKLFADNNMVGTGITFELTESEALNISATAFENIIRIRMLGCDLSLDDFGTGFSSLERLCELPFNELKIDSSFTKHINQDAKYRIATSNIAALAKDLNISVVAEGIETIEQIESLIKLGYSVGQGNIYARPMNEFDFINFLKLRS